MTKDQIAKLLKLLSAGFKLEYKEGTIDFWHIALSDISVEEARVGVAALIKNNKGEYNGVTPAHLLEEINKLRQLGKPQTDYSSDFGTFKRLISQEALRQLGGRSWFGQLPDPANSDNPGAAVAVFERARLEFVRKTQEIVEQCQTIKRQLGISSMPVKEALRLLRERNPQLAMREYLERQKKTVIASSNSTSAMELGR